MKNKTNEQLEKIVNRLERLQNSFERFDRAIIFKYENGASIPVNATSIDMLITAITHPEDLLIEDGEPFFKGMEKETLYAWYRGKEFLVHKADE